MNSAKPSRSRRLAGLLTAIAASLAFLAPAASADFGFKHFDAEFLNADGTPATQAGSHPHVVRFELELNSHEAGPFEFLPDEQLKTSLFEQIPGFIGDATAMPRCPLIDFLKGGFVRKCAPETAVGRVATAILFPQQWVGVPLYNLEPPPGVPVRLAFNILQVSVILDVGLDDSGEGGEYNVIAAQRNAAQALPVFAVVLEIWSDPSSPALDKVRGSCAGVFGTFGPKAEEIALPDDGGVGACPVKRRKPFLTMPTSCEEPLRTSYEIASWENPEAFIGDSVLTHDRETPPNPQSFTGCGKLGFEPRLESTATTDEAETGTGFDVNVDFEDEGLANPDGLAQSQAKKVVLTLPEGVTANPSVGEGLGVCAPADLGRETLHSAPGAGCPNSSKIGTLHVETPLVDEGVDGSVFLAQQDDPRTTTPGAENPFDSLIALYLVLRNPDIGVLIKLPLKVEPDLRTGQLVATLDNIPQLPFSHFNFHFREGQRAPLVSPAACGTYTTEAKFYPRSDPSNPRTVTSSFEITQGVGGGPCPSAGTPPFEPDFEAGAINNNAGSFSPFNMRLLRADGEQDMTKFSSILPPGELGSLAGVSKCPDAAIEAAKAKTGKEERANPSCPSNSLIGHTLAGAGVGSALTYVPGQVYLGGPYKGDPLSVVSVTPALAGPFDAGTVVVRLALTLNPKTAEVEVDGANSDPIPHILKGLVLKVRDLRVYIDRPNFTLNPTNCDESSAKATLFGSYLDVISPFDDVPVDLATRYQAANCLNLGFKPDLSLNLKGGIKRGGHPGLAAIYKPRSGDANVKGLIVRLPRSAFLDQGHIRTICTRVQFASDTCPPAAQYGYIKAWTPLLDEPLQGPVWLRSSDHKLPDLVFDLHGLVDIEVATRIDSARGGIRATVESIPDAAISKVVLKMQGGKKGLIVNSRNLCERKSRANAAFTGQNGKQRSVNPVMRAQCGGKGK